MSRRAVLMSTIVGVAMAMTIPVWALNPPGEMLPDGDTRPVILSAELQAPQSDDALLETGIRIEAEDNDGILQYEYRWWGTVPGDINETSVDDPTISYVSVLPNTDHRLEVRAVDLNGWESDWYPAWSGKTPSRPMIVLAGDSIASGYTRQWFTADATCRDAEFSFGRTVRNAVAASLPPAWTPEYTNIAFPGAGVNSVLNGGSDSCSDVHPSQVDDIERYTNPETWNVVIVTAGINSTNWVDVVKELTKNTALSFSRSGDEAACEVAMTDHWNLDAKRPDITATTSAIVEALDARTNAAVFWASYFGIDGSTIAPGWAPIGPECADEMTDALGALHGAIKAGLDENVTWIDIADLDVSTQMWAGWPHPNRGGHESIGLAVASAITG